MNSLSVTTHVYIHSYKTKEYPGIAFTDIYDSMEAAMEAAESLDPLGNDYPWNISPNGNRYRERPNLLDSNLIIIETIKKQSVNTLADVLILNDKF